MMKTRSTLEHFFTKPVVDLLLKHIVHSERQGLQAVEKKTLVLSRVATEVHGENIIIAAEGNKISVPWRVLFPVIIDAIIRILNIILGKEWIKTEVADSTPPVS